MDGEKKIQDAETEGSIAGSPNFFTKGKAVFNKMAAERSDEYIEFILVLILGVLVGIAAKTEANKRITIGYDDYQMNIANQQYDINKLQSELTKNQAANQADDVQALPDQGDVQDGAPNNNN